MNVYTANHVFLHDFSLSGYSLSIVKRKMKPFLIFQVKPQDWEFIFPPPDMTKLCLNVCVPFCLLMYTT